MIISIEAEAKEIADLILAIQNQHEMDDNSLEAVAERFGKAFRKISKKTEQAWSTGKEGEE